MSALIDIWTNEVAKLREKGQAIFPTGSDPNHVESSPPVFQAKEEKNLSAKFPVFVQEFGMKSSIKLQYSEASVSMLVDCFSP